MFRMIARAAKSWMAESGSTADMSRRKFLVGATAAGGAVMVAPFVFSGAAEAQAIIQTPGGPMTVDEEDFRRRYGRPFPSGRRRHYPRHHRRRYNRRRLRGRARCNDGWFRSNNPGYCGVRRRRRRRSLW